MPAIITHHLFGEDAAGLLPAETLPHQEELLAFLLGNQGPDPLFARIRTLPHTSYSSRWLAHKFHREKITETFASYRRTIEHLEGTNAKIGHAFALGMVAHYTLDCIAHPFIYAQQAAICTMDPSLGSVSDTVHNVIESDLDSWMLWQERHTTILECAPAQNLARTTRITSVANQLIKQAVQDAFCLPVGKNFYGEAVADYEYVYRKIEPLGTSNPEVALFSELGKLARGHSKLRALSHRVIASDECPAANLHRLPWEDPASGQSSTDSFPDVYHSALELWPHMAQCFEDEDWSQLLELTQYRNYEGRPLH